jgi:hypothetical protein
LKRISVLLIVLTILLMAVPTAVLAGDPPNVAEFYWLQTYNGWGPALYYGETVTVVHEGTNRWHFKDGRFQLKIHGTATVYAGGSATGSPIDVRPFENEEMWYEPDNTWGWPVSWWSCGVKRLYYRWSIPGVYDYVVTAKDGYWTLDITVHTSPPTRSHSGWDACP